MALSREDQPTAGTTRRRGSDVLVWPAEAIHAALDGGTRR